MNAVEYNPPKHYVYNSAIRLSNQFETLLEMYSIPHLPFPTGFGRSNRSLKPIGWKRAEVEEDIYALTVQNMKARIEDVNLRELFAHN